MTAPHVAVPSLPRALSPRLRPIWRARASPFGLCGGFLAEQRPPCSSTSSRSAPRYGRWLADHDQILPLDDGHLMALGTQFRKQVPNEERRDTDSTDPPSPRRPPGVAPDPIAEKEKTKKEKRPKDSCPFLFRLGEAMWVDRAKITKRFQCTTADMLSALLCSTIATAEQPNNSVPKSTHLSEPCEMRTPTQ